METGGTDFLDAILEQYGDSMFVVGALDGRALLQGFDCIEREVDRKIALAEKHRMIPSLHLTHLLPEVPFQNYAHYAEYLRQVVVG